MGPVFSATMLLVGVANLFIGILLLTQGHTGFGVALCIIGVVSILNHGLSLLVWIGDKRIADNPPIHQDQLFDKLNE